MAETLTQRLQLIKNDNAELVLIGEINAAFDKIDNNIIPAAKIRTVNGTQSLATAQSTKVTLNTTVYDSWATKVEGAMANPANNRLIAPLTGLYHVEAGACFASNATGYRALGIAVNGIVSPFRARYFKDANTGAIGTLIQVSDDIPLTAADNIECWAVQNSNGPLVLDPAAATADDAIFLSATWIGKIA